MSCCASCGQHACACGCGPRAGTPLPLYNRPGLAAIDYRVGRWGDFRATMQAQLSSAALPALAGLRTREDDDASIALLDAWAMTVDVLSFYQERIANEGYLRTATERLSLAELARLVGYEPRPGVAASVHLAYTLDDNAEPVRILAGSRAQSVPGPGEKMQSFETSDELLARPEWNRLQVRSGRIEQIAPADALLRGGLVLAGAATRLGPGERILFDYTRSAGLQIVRTVASAEADFAPTHDRLNVRLQPTAFARNASMRAVAAQLVATGAAAHDALKSPGAPATPPAWVREVVAALRSALLDADVGELFVRLERNLPDAPPAGVFHSLSVAAAKLHDMLADATDTPDDDDPPPPAASAITDVIGVLDHRAAVPRLPPLSPVSLLAANGDAVPQLLSRFAPRLRDVLYPAWRNLPVSATAATLDGLYALRIAAPLFAYNAPQPPAGPGLVALAATLGSPRAVIHLDNVYSGVLAGSWAIAQVDTRSIPLRVEAAKTVTYSERGVTAATTQLALVAPDAYSGALVRSAQAQQFDRMLVFAQSERLQLARTPSATPLAGASIELDELYDGLKPGRWIIVGGERRDVLDLDGKPVPGIHGGELALVVGVAQAQDPAVPGDYTHTTLQLAQSLRYAYAYDDDLRIYGNVAHATHGETRGEVLGSGDARKPIQRFALKQAPLTYVAAATPQGVATTLEVRVNDVRWHETAQPAFAAPGERVYSVRQDDEGNSTVVFGSRAARVPSGSENLRAAYRSGIGRDGNVKAGQVSLLASKPSGVRDVVNPLRASGGADRDGIEAIRRNAPIAVMALDRLVSLPDYADFARAFAGIGQAAADRVGDRVVVTIAGGDDAPIDEDSDLYHALATALRRYGDPQLRVEVVSRELVALVVGANVALDPDYDWKVVQPQLRAALLRRFAFERRALGRRAYLSEAVAELQRVRGVVYADVDLFDGIDALDLRDPQRLQQRLAALAAADQPHAFVAAHHAREESAADGVRSLRPAQLAYLVPGVSETLVLNLLPSAR